MVLFKAEEKKEKKKKEEMRGQRGRANFLNPFKIDTVWTTGLQIHHQREQQLKSLQIFFLIFSVMHVLLIKMIRRWV